MENRDSNLRERLWRQELSAAERAALFGPSSGPPDLELEARLTQALAALPDAAVPSNFTARVMNAVEGETMRESRRSGIWSLNWRALWPRMARVAGAAVVLLLAGVAVQHYEIHSARVQLAKNLAAVTTVEPLPSMEALENLDAIQRMSQPGHADTELLAALQ